jgi:Zn-dependent protease with chaperone function
MALQHTTAYRYPSEHLILALTVLLVLAVILISAFATFCGSLLFVVIMLGLAYAGTRSHHQSLMHGAHPVTPANMPQLDRLVRECATRLGTGPVEAFVLPLDAMNAYTFGLSSPQVVVLYAPLLRVMNVDELRFIVGHELGHVRLGHTWLNSILGGLAGIPSPYAAAAVLHVAFRWWNRACEFSADRAGLLACGDLHAATTALVRLATGLASRHPADIERAIAVLDRQDDDPGNVVLESLATHPLMIRRVQALRQFAASEQYRQLRTQSDTGLI